MQRVNQTRDKSTALPHLRLADAAPSDAGHLVPVPGQLDQRHPGVPRAPDVSRLVVRATGDVLAVGAQAGLHEERQDLVVRAVAVVFRDCFAKRTKNRLDFQIRVLYNID